MAVMKEVVKVGGGQDFLTFDNKLPYTLLSVMEEDDSNEPAKALLSMLVTLGGKDNVRMWSFYLQYYLPVLHISTTYQYLAHQV